MLIVMRYTNSGTTGDILVNNVATTPVSMPAALQNSTTKDFYVGATDQRYGQDMDIAFTALYARPLSNTECTNIYNVFVPYIDV